MNISHILSVFLGITCLFSPNCLAQVRPKGNRLLGMAVTPAQDNNYNAAMDLAQAAGVQVVSLKLDWDDVEKAPGVYATPWLKVANLYYPGRNIQLSLRIATLDTNRNRIPADLRSKPFDDRAMIERFNKFVDFVFSEIPQVTLTDFSVGNEVDGVLGGDAAQWKQYTRFFAAVREHIHQKRPTVKVGVSMTFSGITGPPGAAAAALEQRADLIMVTYYPLTPFFEVRPPSVVHDDVDAVCKLFPGRTIHFLETGYPSGGGCNSSEEKQKQFIDALFAAWDQHAEQVGLVLYTWETDMAPAAVEPLTAYYRTNTPAFTDYLATLGLRGNAGTDKPAFAAFKAQAKARGW